MASDVDLTREWTKTVPKEAQLRDAITRLGDADPRTVALLATPRHEAHTFIRVRGGWQWRGQTRKDGGDSVAAACALAADMRQNDDEWIDLARNGDGWLRCWRTRNMKELVGPAKLITGSYRAELDVPCDTLVAAWQARLAGVGIIHRALYDTDGGGVTLYSFASGKGLGGLASKMKGLRWDSAPDGIVISHAGTQLLIPVELGNSSVKVGLDPDLVCETPQGALEMDDLGFRILGGVRGEHAVAVLVNGVIAKLNL